MVKIIFTTDFNLYFAIGISELINDTYPKNVKVEIKNDSILIEKKGVLLEGVACVSSRRTAKLCRNYCIQYNDDINTIKSKLKELLTKKDTPLLLNQHNKQSSLTEKESTIIKLISTGCDSQNITKLLGIKKKTFYSHRRSIMKKLGFRNRIDLTLALIDKSG